MNKSLQIRQSTLRIITFIQSISHSPFSPPPPPPPNILETEFNSTGKDIFFSAFVISEYILNMDDYLLSFVSCVC